MRDDEQVRRLQQRVAGRRRLGVGDVERRREEAAVAQRAGERRLVDEPAPGGVDEDRAGLDGGEGRVVDEVARAGGERRVQGDDVGASERGVQIVVAPDREHAHVEARGAARDRPPDAAGADDRERRRVDVGPEPALRLPRAPAPGADVGGGLGEAARGGEEEREGQVGRRVGEHVGRDADGDPARGGGLEVDVVGPDGEVRDRAQARGAVQQLGVDAVGEQAQQRLGVTDAGLELRAGRRQRAGMDAHVVCARQALERVAGERAGDETGGHRAGV